MFFKFEIWTVFEKYMNNIQYLHILFLFLLYNEVNFQFHSKFFSFYLITYQ